MLGHLIEARGQVVEAVKETVMGMGTGKNQEKLQDTPLESAEVKGESMSAEKGVGMGVGTGVGTGPTGVGTVSGTDEEPQRIASRLYVSASK